MPLASPIYLDNHATTRVDPRVLEAMLPYLSEDYGNAGSAHRWGRTAQQAFQQARATVARCIGAEPDEIVFTSGATESNNLAIRGVAGRQRRRGDHFVTVATEHEAVLEPLERLARQGFETTLVDVAPQNHAQQEQGWAGRLDPARLEAQVRDDTALVSVMLANNEIGVVHPIAEIARRCRARGALLHSDATQGVGRLPVDVRTLGVDLMSFTAHKIYGPKGVGALYVRRGRPPVRLEPQITGGGQQRGLRSGTLNVAGCVGLAKALELCVDELEGEAERLTELRELLWTRLTERIDRVLLCGPDLSARDELGALVRIPGNLNVAFAGVDGEALVLAMEDVAVSTGAACATTDPRPSHVLRALGIPDDLARSTLRFGLGRFNTPEQVEYAAEAVSRAVEKLRNFTS